MRRNICQFVGLSFRIPGHIVEFGVADGGSTRVIRRAVSRNERRFPREARKRIFTCDSFKGLPEAFENAGVGTFATTPPSIRRVQIVEGCVTSPYFMRRVRPIDGSSGACCIDDECEASTA